MAPKRQENLIHYHLGNTKTNTRLQQDIKNAFFASIKNKQLSPTHQKTPS